MPTDKAKQSELKFSAVDKQTYTKQREARESRLQSEQAAKAKAKKAAKAKAKKRGARRPICSGKRRKTITQERPNKSVKVPVRKRAYTDSFSYPDVVDTIRKEVAAQGSFRQAVNRLKLDRPDVFNGLSHRTVSGWYKGAKDAKSYTEFIDKARAT